MKEMISRYTDCRSPITLTKQDFADWLESFQSERNWCQYAMTIVHKNGDTAWSANLSLQSFVPRFFSKVISPNWQRAKFIKQMLLVTFLDPPGSRHRDHDNPYERI